MATPYSDDILELPNDIVAKSSGLAFDIGGSVAKVVYRSNKEYKQGKPIDGKASAEKGQIHLAMFSRADNESVINYIADNCDFTRNEDGDILVYATGVGGSSFQTKMEKELGIRIKVLAEFDLFADAFVQLSKILPRDVLVHPLSPEAQAQAEKTVQAAKEWMDKAKETGNLTSDMLAFKELEDSGPEKEADINLPSILVMCGSGTGLMLIKEDGKCDLVDGVFTGGRFFLGLMNQLTGVKDYAKLVELAEAGNGRSVDVYMSDLQVAKSGTDMYNITDYDELVYPFGKGFTSKREDLKDEDIAYSLYNCLAMTHVQVAELSAAIHKVKNVYFCGNFVNSAVVRRAFERNHVMRMMFTPPNIRSEIHFLRHGGMYGALGAFLHKPKEAPATEQARGEVKERIQEEKK